MYQSFEDDSSSTQDGTRVEQLRKVLQKNKLDGFFLQRADEHLSENIPQCAERLAWLTGFTGSAGQAVILKNKAAVFADGRYTLQAKNQLNAELFEAVPVLETPPSVWICKSARKNTTIGFDPRLHPIRQIEKLKKKLTTKDIHLVPVTDNPVDEVWTDQPPLPKEQISIHPMKYAGVKPDEKISEIQKKMAEENINHAIITMPDSIAWLLNIRGKDVPRTPLPLSYAILHAKGKPELFIDPDKLNTTSKKHLEKFVKLFPVDKLETQLQQLSKQKNRTLLDPDTASYWFLNILDNKTSEIVRQQDPCILPKACKNAKEVEGARTAHERDGAAMCRFLAWLDENAPQGTLDEISAAKQLEQFRRETKALKDISFDTISGAGPNGAIIHYRVTESTNRKIKNGSLYLVDSGGQYIDGTTDITRTVAIGQPTKEMCTRFTQVLKGLIAVACARFPKGTHGASIDAFARMALWQAGVDYAHGTGHGVGSYLGVHEGPQGISKNSMVALKPGMILSDEPGYYKEKKYGIRIENLILVTEPSSIRSGEIEMMGFETLTLAPVDTRLVDVNLLDDNELNWLNKYHERVRKTISPHLAKEEKAWLKKATAAMSRLS